MDSTIPETVFRFAFVLLLGGPKTAMCFLIGLWVEDVLPLEWRILCLIAKMCFLLMPGQSL